MYKFERKGCIRITLPVESESQLEGLIDHALASSVDDFEETRLEHNIQVKVRLL